MLSLAITFLIIALIAALLGFTGLAIISVEIAKLLFLVFIVLFVIALIFGLRMRRRPPLVWFFSKVVNAGPPHPEVCARATPSGLRGLASDGRAGQPQKFTRHVYVMIDVPFWKDSA